MGFDTSYQPVDLGLVEGRLLPYLAGTGGEGDLDDLVGRAVAVRRTRFQAKAWALGLLRAARERDIEGFAADVHVWGRPFLITGDDPAGVAEDVLRWLETPPGEVPALAREMISRLDPGLAGAVEPDRDGTLPEDDAVLARHLTWRLRLLRASAAALRAGETTVRDADTGKEHDAAALLRREVPFSVVEFAACLVPGWMSRGHTWPTRLCGAAGTPAEEFRPPVALFALLRDAFPALDWFAPPTITENYMVGGLVLPGDVPAARARLRAVRERLLAPPGDAEPDAYAAGELVKADEALALAERLGLGFCEATEIYSGFGGELN
jgi:hypothetical protein